MAKKQVRKFPFKDGYTAVLESVTGVQWWAELSFHPTRKWRFDYATDPAEKVNVAIEIDGGVFTGGRHSGGAGQKRDMEKMNAAVEEGWAVLHYVPDEKISTYSLEQIKNVVGKRKKFL